MAKAITKSTAGRGPNVLIPVLVATLLAGGGGAFFGMQIPVAVPPPETAPKPEETRKPADDGMKTSVRMLAPITTNLASPPNTWIRLETAAVIKGDLGPEGTALLSKLAEDVVAYLRTVPLGQIEGASGFQHLREDLNDRVRIRSQGKIDELMIQALVIQ